MHHDRVFRHGKVGDNNNVLAVLGADVIHLCVADLLLSADVNGFNNKLSKGLLSVRIYFSQRQPTSIALHMLNLHAPFIRRLAPTLLNPRRSLEFR